jgi:uncharacterized protein
MLVGEDACFMLITTDRFKEFSKRPVGNATQETTALFAITVGSREDVDAFVKTAIAAGGSPVADAQDLG